MSISRLKALMLLSECTGDDIWSADHCRSRGVPSAWLEQLQDCFESNHARDDQTIFYQEGRVHQFEGVRDVDLAIRIAEFLGLDVPSITATALSRRATVRALKEAAEEMD